jgi:hypothetical protein
LFIFIRIDMLALLAGAHLLAEAEEEHLFLRELEEAADWAAARAER